MDEEIVALERSETYMVIPRPGGKSIDSSKWIYKIKRNSGGTTERYKARGVARGFTITMKCSPPSFDTDPFDYYSPSVPTSESDGKHANLISSRRFSTAPFRKKYIRYYRSY